MKIVIVGAGPCGLTMAHYLTRLSPADITVIDREATIGGCHRVRRVNGYFTEHSARIYTGAYVNFARLLRDFGYEFHDLFTPYDFPITEVGRKTIFGFRFTELLPFIWEFFKLSFTDSSKEISVLEFATRHNFSQNTINYLDRLCRLTDGARVDNYTLYELLQMLNEHAFYKVYQPKYANDTRLFPAWQEYLTNRGVKFLLNTEIRELYFGQSLVPSVGVPEGVVTTDGAVITADVILVAVPPKNVLKLGLVSKERPISFPRWVRNSSYVTYISITYHFNRKVPLPREWGFSDKPWGVFWIVLSDYFDEKVSHTSPVLISAVISMPDTKSPVTGKTANETDDRDELARETWRQLNEILQTEQPDVSIVSPGVYRSVSDPSVSDPSVSDPSVSDPSGSSRRGVWEMLDSSFILSAKEHGRYLSPKTQYPNVFQVGTQNGNSRYTPTSLESAVTNGMYFVREYFGRTLAPAPLSPWKVTDIILSIVVVLSTFLVISIFILIRKRKSFT